MNGQWFSVCNYDELELTPLLNTSAIITQITKLLVDSYLVVTCLFELVLRAWQLELLTVYSKST